MMHKVIEFNRTILHIQRRPIGLMKPSESNHLFLALTEEAKEFEQAQLSGNLLGSVDALVDSIYFALGGLYKMGLTPKLVDDIFSAVHDANMTKKKGVVARRDTGAPDAIKPEDWIPPEERIGYLIDAHMIEEEAQS